MTIPMPEVLAGMLLRVVLKPKGRRKVLSFLLGYRRKYFVSCFLDSSQSLLIPSSKHERGTGGPNPAL
jgi:hypothetical protein